MKILHLETGRHFYGGPLQVYYLIRELELRGVDNILVCPRNSAIAEKCRDLCLVIECEYRGDLDFSFPFKLTKIIRKNRIDILHIHSRKGADYWGAFAAKWAQIPAVLSRRVDNREPRWLAKWKYRQFNCVLAVSNEIKTILVSEGVDAKKIITVYDAVDTQRYQPNSNSGYLSTHFNIDDFSCVIAIVAQLIERKGHRYLFDCVKLLREENRDIKVLVLGRGPLESDLKAYCQAIEIQESIIFCGFREDLDRLLPDVDILVHPALKEGLGVAILQGSACGLPIVASAVGGIKEVIIHDKTGVLVEPASSSQLAKALTFLIDQPRLRQQLASNARERMMSSFSIKKMAADTLQVYRTILK